MFISKQMPIFVSLKFYFCIFLIRQGNGRLEIHVYELKFSLTSASADSVGTAFAGQSRYLAFNAFTVFNIHEQCFEMKAWLHSISD